jgi:hypothetical protein
MGFYRDKKEDLARPLHPIATKKMEENENAATRIP